MPVHSDENVHDLPWSEHEFPEYELLIMSLALSAAELTATTMMMMMMIMIRSGMPMQSAQQIPQAQRPALAAFLPSSLDDLPILN